MPKSRRGKGTARADLWRVVGGIDELALSFLKADMSKQDTTANSAIWSTLAERVFQNDTPKNRKWLYVVWRYNRKNIRGLVGDRSQLKETTAEEEDSLSDTSAVSHTEKLTEPDVRDEITSETAIEQETEQNFPKTEDRKPPKNDDASHWAEELPVQVLLAKHSSQLVMNSLTFLQALISKEQREPRENGTDQDPSDTWEDEEDRRSSISGHVQSQN
ncbi:hypothetical protein Q8A67_005697 [Cirrhinus molitorella]|uniref:Uncharacterized protein n=1 Tax=Cirrhinus molitorella TaxID=172907 RepID=A0AA88TRZ6_9TELE|nr:hypothetical protein Q8A67_005697 [Cirrhinus molitorella]